MASTLNINYVNARISSRVGARSFITKPPFYVYFRKAAATASSTCCSITCSASPQVVKNKSPWLMLPPSLNGTQLVYDFYSLSDDRIISFNKTSDPEFDDELPDDESEFLGSSHGWIVCHNWHKEDGKIFLSNPLTHRHIKLPELPPCTGICSGSHAMVENVIISSPDPANDPDCRAVMRYSPGKLAVCCPARPNSKWALFGEREKYCSAVYSARQKLFFCLNEEGVENYGEEAGIEAWDLTNLDSPVMIPVKDLCLDDLQSLYPAHVDAYGSPSAEKSWFSELEVSSSLAVADDSDDLYQVRRFTASWMGPDGSHGKIIKFSHDSPVELPFNTSVHFDVYKYDKGLREWKYMDHSRSGALDGMAIFVGINHGFALSSKDYPDIKPDSVYFTDIDESPCPGDVHGGLDLGIFNYQTKTISPCYYPCDYPSKTKKELFPPPFWFTPNTCA